MEKLEMDNCFLPIEEKDTDYPTNKLLITDLFNEHILHCTYCPKCTKMSLKKEDMLAHLAKGYSIIVTEKRCCQ